MVCARDAHVVYEISAKERFKARVKEDDVTLLLEQSLVSIGGAWSVCGTRAAPVLNLPT